MDPNAPKTNEKFDAAFAEAVSHAATQLGSPLRVAAPQPNAPGRVGGPIADAVLVPAKKILGDLIVTHGPEAVNLVIDFLRGKIPF